MEPQLKGSVCFQIQIYYHRGTAVLIMVATD